MLDETPPPTDSRSHIPARSCIRGERLQGSGLLKRISTPRALDPAFEFLHTGNVESVEKGATVSPHGVLQRSRGKCALILLEIHSRDGAVDGEVRRRRMEDVRMN